MLIFLISYLAFCNGMRMHYHEYKDKQNDNSIRVKFFELQLGAITKSFK